MPRSINNSDVRRSLDSRFPVLNFPNIVRLTANDKDFSLALEMTIRESDVSKSLSLLVTSHASPRYLMLLSEAGRMFLAPHRGSSSKGEARRYVANNFLNLIALILRGGGFPLSHYPRSADRMPAAPFSPDLAILPLFSLFCVMRHLLDTDLTKK